MKIIDVQLISLVNHTKKNIFYQAKISDKTMELLLICKLKIPWKLLEAKLLPNMQRGFEKPWISYSAVTWQHAVFNLRNCAMKFTVRTELLTLLIIYTNTIWQHVGRSDSPSYCSDHSYMNISKNYWNKTFLQTLLTNKYYNADYENIMALKCLHFKRFMVTGILM